MINEESKRLVTEPSNRASKKGKEREVVMTAMAMSSSSSRGSRGKGEGRALSSPSFNPSLAAKPGRDVTPTNGAVFGASKLQAMVAPEVPSANASSRREHHKSTPTVPTPSMLATPPDAIQMSYSNGSGKRKADEAGVSGDKTPPKESREPRTTFAPEPRLHRPSATSGASSHAPSSFNRSKRVRLTETPDGRMPISRAGSLPTPNDSPPNAKTTGSWSSKGSHGGISHSSHNYGPPLAASASYVSQSQQHHRTPSRRSLSQASVPISALISPHAPSIDRLSTFHMRDPRKPSPIQRTPWFLSLPLPQSSGGYRFSADGWLERGGSPLHAWLFFIGFVLFPLWWVAALLIPIPRTRTLGGTADTEKGVILDDPQLEHDAKSWRTRCRVMAGVSLFTYVPFVILVAVYA